MQKELKTLLTKREKAKVEFLDSYDDGDSGWICYVRAGFTLRGEDGPSFCEDTLEDIKATLKLVCRSDEEAL